jgi:hypothetical protein
VSDAKGTHQVMIKLTPYYHKELSKMALRRSAELGSRVSMGFVLQELIQERLQMGKPEGRSADLFASHE